MIGGYKELTDPASSKALGSEKKLASIRFVTLASHPIRHGWGLLPEVVVSYKPMTTAGYPTVRAKRTLFTHIFDRTLTGFVMHANREVDTDTERGIESAILRAAPMLVLVRDWHEALVSAHKRHVREGGVPLGTDEIEKLFTKAWLEASGDLSAIPALIQSRSGQIVAIMANNAGLSRAHVALTLEDESVVVEAFQLLDAEVVKHATTMTAPTRATLDTVRDLALKILRHARVGGGTTSVTDGTGPLWNRLQVLEDLATIPRPRALGLIAGAVAVPLSFWPRDPEWEQTCESLPPLDQSVVERLLSIYQNQAFVAAAPDATTLIKQVVVSASSPLGLSSRASLATMVLAQFAVSALTVSVEAVGIRGRAQRALLANEDLVGAIQIFSRKWNAQRHVRQELARAGTYPRHVVDFLESPEIYYFARLWKRVHAAQYSTSRIDSFSTSWEHIYGALISTIGQVSHLSSGPGIREISINDKDNDDQRWLKARRELKAAATESLGLALVKEICAVAARTDGAEVLAFVQWAKTRSIREAGGEWPSHEAKWEQWCKQFLELKPTTVDQRTGETMASAITNLPTVDQAVVHIWLELEQ